METFLDLVREVANRLQCPWSPEDSDGGQLDLMSHRYEAFTVLWTVMNDDELMNQLRTSRVKHLNRNIRDLF
jgi:hypothetical protein